MLVIVSVTVDVSDDDEYVLPPTDKFFSCTTTVSVFFCCNVTDSALLLCETERLSTVDGEVGCFRR